MVDVDEFDGPSNDPLSSSSSIDDYEANSSSSSFLLLENSTGGASFTPPSSSSSSSEEYPFVWVYISPAILLVGVFGNTLILLVMRRPRLRDTTTSVYLSLMSVADTGALLFRILPEFLSASAASFSFAGLNVWTCRLEKYSFYTASDVAIWILVAFTFDRLIAVCFPLQKRRVCKPRTALAVALTITGIASVKNLHIFWTRGIKRDPVSGHVISPCERLEYYRTYEYYVRPWVAFVTVSVIPFCTIVVCNCLIVRTLAYVGRLRGSAWRKTFTQTSLMCLSVSLMFLVFVTPSIVLTVGRAHWDTGSSKYAYNIARTFNNQLACLNHAINFFLYCLTGERFRTELLYMFHLRRPTESVGGAGGGVGGPQSNWSIGGMHRRLSTAPTTTRSSTSLLALQAISFTPRDRRRSTMVNPSSVLASFPPPSKRVNIPMDDQKCAAALIGAQMAPRQNNAYRNSLT